MAPFIRTNQWHIVAAPPTRKISWVVRKLLVSSLVRIYLSVAKGPQLHHTKPERVNSFPAASPSRCNSVNWGDSRNPPPILRRDGGATKKLRAVPWPGNEPRMSHPFAGPGALTDLDSVNDNERAMPRTHFCYFGCHAKVTDSEVC